MNESLLLRIRAETLRANLEQTSRHLKMLPSLKEHLDSIEGRLKEIRRISANAKRNIHDLEYDVDQDDNPPAPDAVIEKLKSISKLLDTAQYEVRAASNDIEQMRKKSFRMQDNAIETEASNHLEELIMEPILELEKIQRVLETDRVAITSSTWRDSFQNAAEKSQTIFKECLELLGGIALRDARFDIGICQVADELIYTYRPNRQGQISLRVIPGSVQAMVIRLARIVRLNFPEWTIWALPFTAREFWHIVARQDLVAWLKPEIDAVAEVEGEPAVEMERRFQDCLADAFATYTMGPAYAYATVTLLLDPCAPFAQGAGRVSDEVRVHGILEMLACMDSKASLLALPYEAIRADLKNAWDAAKAQAETVATPEESQQIAQDTKQASKLVQALWKVLEGRDCAPLTVEAWNQLQPWRKALLEGKVKDLKLEVGAELRQVLNAAWLARVDPTRKPEVKLTEAVHELINMTIEQKAAASASPRDLLRRGVR